MGILSRLMGTAQGTAARGGRAGRSAGRPATGRRGMGTGGMRSGGMRSGGMGGTGRMARRTSTTGRAGTPAAGGGLGKLIGSLTKRR